MYYWKGLLQDVNVGNYIKKCDVCQRVNNRIGKVRAELHPVPVSKEVWKQIGIDIIGNI